MLPKITSLFKEIVLPVCNKKVKVYAYNIYENKALLLAKGVTQNENSNKDVANYIIELLKNKIDGVDDIEELTISDIIVAFINLVSISKGVKNTLYYQCLNKIDGEECNTQYSVTVDFSDYKIENNDEIRNNIYKINDNISIQFKYPSYKIIKELEDIKDDTEKEIRLLSKCIDVVYDSNDDTYTEFDENEIYEWAKELPISAWDIFSGEFLNTIPTISLEWVVECPKCHAKAIKRISNLVDFFIQSTQTKN